MRTDLTLYGAGGSSPDPVPDGVLLCLSHLRWNFVYQRPQHLLSRAGKTRPVLFFEEPMYEPVATPRLALTEAEPGVIVAVPVLPTSLYHADVNEVVRDLLDEALEPYAGAQLTVWYYTAMALAFSSHLKPDLTVYDCMDELSAFKNPPPRLKAFERELMARADIVFTGGQSLYEAKVGRHANLHAFPSSIDAAHFAGARNAKAPDPADQAALPHPCLGFFGVVDERMDVELMGAMAEARPDWSFVVLGPVVKIDPASLPKLPNLHWLGGKSYKELPAYLAHWDVGVMPFAINEATKFISPTKTPEFLAAGVPVVSTRIRDVVRPYADAGLVAIADDAAGFIAAAEAILARTEADAAAWLAKVDRQLAGGSWDRTWNAMAALMTKAMADKARRLRTPANAGVARTGAPLAAEAPRV